MIKFSVIIPVYNVEAYLERCIDSILLQDYQDLEIIIINDGSTDRSPNICEDYAEKDSRIKVIHQLNKGLPGARNSGLKIAKGEYIFFLDSDDYIEQNFFKILNNSLLGKEDVLSFNYKIVRGENIKYLNKEDHITINQQFLLQALKNTAKTDFFWFVWRRVYKNDFIIKNSILFDESVKFGEDTIFSIELFSNNPSYKHITDFLINYCSNPTSLARIKYKENLLEKINNHFAARLRVEEKFGRSNNKEIVEDISNYYLEHALFLLFNNVKNFDGNKIDELKAIRQAEFYKFSYKNYKFKTGKVGLALKIVLFNLKFYKTLIKLF